MHIIQSCCPSLVGRLSVPGLFLYEERLAECLADGWSDVAENRVPERFDWLSNVGAYVKAYGRVRLYVLILSAFDETWESTELYEVRVEGSDARWYPAPAITIARSGVHDVLDHLHKFSSAEAASISSIRLLMGEDRQNGSSYFTALEAHNERYRAVEDAIVQLEEELFAAD